MQGTMPVVNHHHTTMLPVPPQFLPYLWEVNDTDICFVLSCAKYLLKQNVIKSVLNAGCDTDK